MNIKIYTVILSCSILMMFGNLTAQAPGWLWAKAIGGEGRETMFTSAIDPNGSGDIYSTGTFEGTTDFDPGVGTFELTSNGGSDIFITKFDASGNFVWAKSFGGAGNDFGITVALDNSGNVFFSSSYTGTVDVESFHFIATGINDLIIGCLNVDGNLLWAKSIGGELGIFTQGMIVDPENGDIYTTGRYTGTIDFDPDTLIAINHTAMDWDIFTLKLDVDGNFEWVASAGSPGYDDGYAIAFDPTGNGSVYSTGAFKGTVDFDPDPTAESYLTCPGNQCLFITKLDAEGDFIWANTITSPNNIYGRAIALDPSNGDIYMTGVFNGTVDFDPGKGDFNITPNGYDAFISKLHSDGSFAWAKAMGSSGFDIGYSIAVDPVGSGDVYTTGLFSGTVDFDPGSGVAMLTSKGLDDTFISKLDRSGNFVWAKSVGGDGYDYGFSILPDLNGQVYLAGQFTSASVSLDSTVITNADEAGTTYDIFIAKMDASFPSAVNGGIYENGISIYPNPIRHTLTIDVDKRELSNIGISMYNSSGAVCYSVKGQHIINDRTIDVSELPSGTYFIELEMDGKKFVSKVIKE